MMDRFSRIALGLFILTMTGTILCAQEGEPPHKPDTIGVQPRELPGGEARWFENVRQLTSVEMGLDAAGEAYFSPDEKRIAFQAHPRGKTDYQIYVMNIDGTGLEMVSTGEGATTCSYFHPDGTKLIFAANHHDQRPAVMPEEVRREAEKAGQRQYKWPFYPGMDIYEYTFATKQLRRLTTADGYDAECAYSPDGKHIVFSSMRDGDQEIYICDADGKNARRITHAKGYDGGPFFSPDGKRIVYRADRLQRGRTMQIFTNNLAGTAEKAITGHDVLNWCPYWHPSGKWLIFTRADHSVPRNINYDLYLLRDDGSDVLRVTTDRASDVLPVFSPDGKMLMWTSKRGGLETAQVFLADFIGLTPDGELAGAPPTQRQ